MDNECLRNKKQEVKDNGNKILIKEERRISLENKMQNKKNHNEIRKAKVFKKNRQQKQDNKQAKHLY